MDRVIVLFKVTLKEGKNDDYLKMAASLKDSLADAKGFIHSERFSSLATKGKLLSMSAWKDEESVTKWRNQAQHRMCQEHGRIEDFADYKITVVTPLRSYTMTDRKNAPADSNEYFGGELYALYELVQFPCRRNFACRRRYRRCWRLVQGRKVLCILP